MLGNVPKQLSVFPLPISTQESLIDCYKPTEVSLPVKLSFPCPLLEISDLKLLIRTCCIEFVKSHFHATVTLTWMKQVLDGPITTQNTYKHTQFNFVHTGACFWVCEWVCAGKLSSIWVGGVRVKLFWWLKVVQNNHITSTYGHVAQHGLPICHLWLFACVCAWH